MINPDDDTKTGKPTTPSTTPAAVVPIRGGINVDLGVSADDDSRIVLPESLTLEQMLKRFVHVSRGPMIVDIENTYRQLNPREFAATYAHNTRQLEKGDKAIPVTKLWQNSPGRLSVDALGFHPGEGKFYRESGVAYLNLWIPPSWPAMDPEDALEASQPFFDHLTYLIPDEVTRNDLIDWLAHATQDPDVRPHHHFLLIAPQEGTGRDLMVNILECLWGERHAGFINLHDYMKGPHNEHMSGKILISVHEIKAPPREQWEYKERLKTLMTDDQININPKHKPMRTERFRARLMMLANDENALPVSEGERRIYTGRCADQFKDEAYYKRLYGIYKDNRKRNHMLTGIWQLLRTRDLSKFNPGRRAPLNEMKRAMIAAGRSDEQSNAVEFARKCPFDVVGSNDLIELLAPKLDNESQGDWQRRHGAIAAALRSVGCQRPEKKIWLNERSQRFW
ncbi:MAG TPA: primase-helicase family protein, partial [Gammaproteobacteria bacterium]|nr:primase-helicase family protein [Gammaproteobacteria bacterium]